MGGVYGYVGISDGERTEIVQRREIGGVGRQLQDDPAEGDSVAERAPQHGWVQEQGQRTPEVVE